MSRELQTQAPNVLRSALVGQEELTDWRWSIIAALTAVIASSAVIFDAPSPFRPFAIFVFLGIGPGLGLAGLLGINDLTQRIVLSMGLSLALDTIVGCISLYAGFWSPFGVLMILTGITFVGFTLRVWLAMKAQRIASRGSTANRTKPGWMNVNAAPKATAVAASPVIVDPFHSTGVLTDSRPNRARAGKVHVGTRGPMVGLSPGLPPQLTRGALLIAFIGGSIMLITMGARRTLQG